MMNRSLLQRQMFRNGGAAGMKSIPVGNAGLRALAKERPDVVRNMGYIEP